MKKNKQKNTKRLKIIRVTALLFLLSVSFAGSAVLFVYILPQKEQLGRLGPSLAISGNAPEHSLDISIASQASYPSTPISFVRALGTDNGLIRQVVKFSVKDDGLSEYALLEKPSSAPPPKGFPVIILLHGYVNPEHYLSLLAYREDMDFYARKGFLVVKPDLRGQGLSIGSGEASSAYYSMDYNIDVMSLIEALKQTKDIDKDNFNLWGHSMGAYIALRAAVMSKDIKNTILLSEPGGSLRDIYLSYVPPSDENNLPALKTRSDVFSKYGTPAENPDFWQKASPSSYLGQMVSRIQIHVGSDDVIVPTHLSADLDAALNNAHKTHQYYVYDGADHGLATVRQLIWSRSMEYLSADGQTKP